MKNSLRVFDEASVCKLWDYMDGVKNDMARDEKEAAGAGAEAEEAARKEQEPEAKSAGGKPKKGPWLGVRVCVKCARLSWFVRRPPAFRKDCPILLCRSTEDKKVFFRSRQCVTEGLNYIPTENRWEQRKNTYARCWCLFPRSCCRGDESP